MRIVALIITALLLTACSDFTATLTSTAEETPSGRTLT